MPLTITYDAQANDYVLGNGPFTELQYRGELNAHADPLYPKASRGDFWRIRRAGKVGGPSGDAVVVGQYILAMQNAEAGTKAEVGSSWVILNASALGNAEFIFSNLDLSTLPTADPGNGKPWLNGGLIQVGP